MLVHQTAINSNPHAIAFVFKGQEMSYQDFANRIDSVRNYLYAQGVRPGDNIGLMCRNCPDFVVCYYAIISLQAVVVPFNPVLTMREVDYMAEDSRMHIVVNQTRMELDDSLQQLIIPEFLGADGPGEWPSAPVDPKFNDDHDCVIIYTSGTTGFPKGAVLTHRNLVSNAQAIADVLTMQAYDRSFAALPMFHSYAWTVTIVAPLLTGGSISVLETFTPKEAVATIRDTRCSIVNGVPAMYNLYVSHANSDDFKEVRIFVSGGASLPLEVLKKFGAKTGKAVMEGYGLSEASPVVTMNPLRKCRPGSIGVAVPGVQVMITGDDNKELAPHERGELCVRGPNVMKGYFNKPDATANAIVGGWLHTGDIAYADDEGYIFIVDRLKDLIIVGGLNVYPREVEEVIYQFPGIKEAAVVGIDDRTRGEAAYAFIVPLEGNAPDEKALREFLQHNLAPYKQPREIISLTALPRNAGGKVLKKDLRATYLKARN